MINFFENIEIDDELYNENHIYRRYYIDSKPTKYIISNYGEVYSEITKKFLKPSIASHGYYNVNLYVDGHKFTKTIHTMVAETFIPVRMEWEIIVNHKDGNKLNNYYKNLEWCTYSHNNKHAIENGLNSKPPTGNGEKNPFSKYTDSQIENVCKLMEKGYKNTQIIEITGIPRDTIVDIRLGRSHTHISSKYNIPKDTISQNKEIRDKIKKYIIESGDTDLKHILSTLNIENTDKYRRMVKYILRYYLKIERFND